MIPYKRNRTDIAEAVVCSVTWYPSIDLKIKRNGPGESFYCRYIQNEKVWTTVFVLKSFEYYFIALTWGSINIRFAKFINALLHLILQSVLLPV